MDYALDILYVNLGKTFHLGTIAVQCFSSFKTAIGNSDQFFKK